MELEEKFSFFYKNFEITDDFSFDDLLDKIRDQNNDDFTIQILDPAYLVSKKHLKIGIYHTYKAFRQKYNIARDKGTELLLRLSGKRQIQKAMNIFGISQDSKNIMFLAFGTIPEKKLEKKLEEFISKTEFVNSKPLNKLPLLEEKTLSAFYETEHVPSNIEKCAIERMASLVIEQK